MIGKYPFPSLNKSLACWNTVYCCEHEHKPQVSEINTILHIMIISYERSLRSGLQHICATFFWSSTEPCSHRSDSGAIQ